MHIMHEYYSTTSVEFAYQVLLMYAYVVLMAEKEIDPRE